MSEFNPDWDVKEAALDSLREHMAIARDLKAKNQQLQDTNKQLLEALEGLFSLVDEGDRTGHYPILVTGQIMAKAETAITNAKQMGDSDE